MYKMYRWSKQNSNKRETCLLIDKLPLGDPLKSTGSQPLSISSSEKWEDSINRFQASTTATHTEKYISYQVQYAYLYIYRKMLFYIKTSVLQINP